MADHYDAVIVGSGYGGGITAARLARAGARVCILERGKELHPGEYPSGAGSAPKHIQANTARGRIGSPTALIDFHIAKDIGVVRGCGLGGTSLINANVSRRADERVFDDERWPAELRVTGAATLKPYYERAEAMLGSKLPPRTLLDLPKTRALARSAAALGAEFNQARLNVTFEDGPNAAGVMQNACTLCGDCVSGCNHNAKNTVLMNYIPDAHRHGAHIFCEVSVRTVQKHAKGWLVEFADQSFGARRFGSPTHFVTADVVVLAAGSLGSTEILLRSRASGLDVSGRLGHSFTGNGDVLAFAFDADTKLNSVGAGKKAVTHDTAVGPCIAGMVDVKGVNGADDFLIQEGSVPGSTGWVSGLVWAVSALLFGDDGTQGLPRLRKRLWQFVRSLFGPRVGPPSRSMTYLVMSIDDDNGELALEGDRLDIKWPDIAQRPVFRAINEQLATAGKALGGSFVPSPMWASPVGSTLLTVQPLGGCDMGDDATHGVVNHKGQVFAGQTGTAVHDGLYVADGAVIPRPLGANPSLTISAVAERISDMLVADRGYAATPAAPAQGHTEPGVRFSERLKGHFSTKVREGYGAGEQQGKSDRSPLDLTLTISYDSLDMLRDGTTTGDISGSVFAPALSPQRLVCSGTFRLFVPDPRFVETWHMRYELEMRTEDGTTYGLRAFKLLRERGSLDAWGDTTTAFVKVTDASEAVIGVGIIRIGMLDFAKLLSTVEGPGSSGTAQGWKIRFGFMRMFVKNVLSMYGGPLDSSGAFPPPSAPELPAPMRVLRVEETERHWVDRSGTWRSGDAKGSDAAVQLIRYQGGTKGPVILACGFGMSATSYVLDTTDTNLVEFLTERDYDVWLFDHRGGIFMPGREEQFTLDDVATKDWPAAIGKVREVTGADDVQVVAHCAGALTLQMALLNGMSGVRSAVSSALTVFFTPNPLKKFLNGLGLEGMIAKIGIKGFTPPTRPTLLNRIIDIVLRLHPIPHEERCGQAICRWVNGIYGPSWHHPQLNEATHEALWSAFGFGNFSAGRQFGAMFKVGHVLDSEGKDTYLGHPERLAVPLLFLHGGKSYMFNPNGSAKTLRWLRKHNDPSLYERIVLPDYGHVDTFVGRNAHVDVFPLISEHLDRFA